jgi:hypothetical protein
MGGPEISEAEHEVTLKEEEPVVEKRTVPRGGGVPLSTRASPAWPIVVVLVAMSRGCRG